MVSPTNFSSPDPPEPKEPKDNADVESPIPKELVIESLPPAQVEKELEKAEFSFLETPTEETAATTEIASEILNLPSTEDVEIEEEKAAEDDNSSEEELSDPNSDDQGLENAQILEGEMEDWDEMEMEDENSPEEPEEEALNLSTETIPDDLLDPEAQDFRKLLDELLPLDDHAHIITPEEIDRATYLIDLDHHMFYTNHPLTTEQFIAFKPTLLLLEYTEEEISHFKISFIKPKKWARLIHYLKTRP